MMGLMTLNTVYIGLGGNIGDTYAILNNAINDLKGVPGVVDVETSGFYRTPPVSTVPQDDFVNAVCRFKTTMDHYTLLRHMQDIEVKNGKVPKPKDAVRPLDLDLLFYEGVCCEDPLLEIPHPRWKYRLFVLIPLSDLTKTIDGTMDIMALIYTFPLAEREQIKRIEKENLCIVSP